MWNSHGGFYVEDRERQKLSSGCCIRSQLFIYPETKGGTRAYFIGNSKSVSAKRNPSVPKMESGLHPGTSARGWEYCVWQRCPDWLTESRVRRSRGNGFQNRLNLEVLHTHTYLSAMSCWDRSAGPIKHHVATRAGTLLNRSHEMLRSKVTDLQISVTQS